MNIFINNWLDDPDNPMLLITIKEKRIKADTYLHAVGMISDCIRELEKIKSELTEKEERRIDNAERNDHS